MGDVSGFRVPYEASESEFVEKRSRFISHLWPVETEEEARAFIAEIRSKHRLATHVCFAFIADKLGNLQRFSDDGEPQGTAGMPILVGSRVAHRPTMVCAVFSSDPPGRKNKSFFTLSSTGISP